MHHRDDDPPRTATILPFPTIERGHEDEHEHDENIVARSPHARPALRPPVVPKLPEGRKQLAPHWWRQAFEPGTTVLYRDILRSERTRRRAKSRLKHDPDARHQNDRRHILRSEWQAMVIAGHLRREPHWEVQSWIGSGMLHVQH